MGKPKRTPKWKGCILEIHGEEHEIDGPVDTIMAQGFPGYSDGLGQGVFLVVIESEGEAERFEKAANHAMFADVIWETRISRDDREYLDSLNVTEFEALVAEVTAHAAPAPEVPAPPAYTGAMEQPKVPATRKYRANEIPAVGDVIKAFDGSFASCVIVRVNSPGKGEGEVTYDLERPNAKLDLGVLSISIERIGHVSLKSIRENYEAYTTGSSGTIENRSY